MYTLKRPYINRWICKRDQFLSLTKSAISDSKPIEEPLKRVRHGKRSVIPNRYAAPCAPIGDTDSKQYHSVITESNCLLASA